MTLVAFRTKRCLDFSAALNVLLQRSDIDQFLSALEPKHIIAVIACATNLPQQVQRQFSSSNVKRVNHFGRYQNPLDQMGQLFEFLIWI